MHFSRPKAAARQATAGTRGLVPERAVLVLSEITTEKPCEPLKYHIVRFGTIGYLSAYLHQECTLLIPPMAPSKPFDHPHPRIAASTAEVEWFLFWAKNDRGNRKHSTTTAVTAEIQATPRHKHLTLVKATLIPLVVQSPHNCTSFSNQGGGKRKSAGWRSCVVSDSQT